LVHTIKRRHSSAQMLASGTRPRKDGVRRTITDREKVREAIGPQSVLKDRKDFSHPSVFDANQQFQILRFYFDPDKPTGVKLQRTVMARLPNSPDGYTPIPELGSETWMPLSQAMT
jgi:hypothetical protein